MQSLTNAFQTVFTSRSPGNGSALFVEVGWKSVMAHGITFNSSLHGLSNLVYQNLGTIQNFTFTNTLTFINRHRSIFLLSKYECMVQLAVQDLTLTNSSFSFRVISVEWCAYRPRERQKLATVGLLFLVILTYHQLYFCRHSLCNYSRY